MKRPYLLDFNILHFAATLTNEKGEYDLTSYELVVAVFEQCHPLVVTYDIYAGYMSRLSRLHATRVPIVTSLLRLFGDLRYHQDKGQWFSSQDPSPLPEEGQFDPNDAEFVRLAAHVDRGVILATTDDKLRTDLSEGGIRQKYNFDVLRPEAAIHFIELDE